MQLHIALQAELLHQIFAHAVAAKLQLDERCLIKSLTLFSSSHPPESSKLVQKLFKHLKMESAVGRRGCFEEVLEEQKHVSRLDNLLKI